MKDPQFLSRHQIKVNQPLADLTSIGVGGSADFFRRCDNLQQLVRLLDAAAANSLRVQLLGAGTSSVISDHGLRGLCIANRMVGWDVTGSVVAVASGTPLNTVLQAMAEHGLGGLEQLAAETGSIGAAVRRNAEQSGQALCDRIERVSLYSKGSVISAEPTDLDFSPGSSRFSHSSEIVLSVTIRLSKTDPDQLRHGMLAAVQDKLRRQPGGRQRVRIFRDLPRESAGSLAELAGMAGERIGGASVSRKDANYITNDGTATAADVYQLAQRIKHRVSVKLQKKLVEEVSWLGEW